MTNPDGMKHALQCCCHVKCDAPATIHLLVLDGETGTMSCPEYLALCKSLNTVQDEHSIMGTCGIPGAMWVYSWSSPGGYCEVQGLQIDEVRELEASLS